MLEPTFLILLGFMLIILGFLFIATGIIRSAQEEAPHGKLKEEKVKGGGVIMIGPIPIIFGSDKRFALIAMVLAIVLILLTILFFK